MLSRIPKLLIIFWMLLLPSRLVQAGDETALPFQPAVETGKPGLFLEIGRFLSQGLTQQQILEVTETTAPALTPTPTPTVTMAPIQLPEDNPIPDWEIPDPPLWDWVKEWLRPYWGWLGQILPTVGGISLPVLAAGPVGEIGLWLFYIILFSLLLGLLAWLVRRFRRRSSPPPVMMPRQATPPPSRGNLVEIPELPMKLPNWLITLGDDHKLMVSAPEKSPDLQDTLLIGIGLAGREVLSQIAQVMNSRFGESWPANIHLLQVDVQPEQIYQHLEPPAGLKPAQHIVLKPNYHEVERNLRERPNDWEHWGWFKNAAPMYDRARSRMALFFDLKDGGENSRLWTSISRAHLGLKNPTMRLIGSTFDDVSSGMLVDMIRICQLASGRPNMDVQLWLMGPQNREWSGRVHDPQQKLSASEQSKRTLATLRELERFQRNETNSFQYVPPGSKYDYLRQDYTGAVVQTVFIFQPIKQVHPEDPRYRVDPPPEIDALSCMADSLMALFNPQANQALIRYLGNQRTEVIDQVNRKGTGMVSAIGGYTVRLPFVQLERALAWRMVRDSLYEIAVGLSPMEKYADGDAVPGEYRSIQDTASRSGPVRPGVPAGIDGFDLSRWLKPSNRLNDPGFVTAVGSYVQSLLNGGDEPGVGLSRRGGGLQRAISQLSLLSTELRKHNATTAALRVLELTRALQEWQSWIQGSLRNACQQKFDYGQQELAQLKDQPARTWALEAGSEWSMYRQHIREWLDTPGSNVTSEPLLRMGRHFGWQISLEGGRLIPRLLVTGREYTWSEKTLISDLAVSSNVDQVLSQLYQLAEPLARSALRLASPRQLANSQDLHTWISRASARLRRSGTRDVNRRLLLVEPGLGLQSGLQKALDALEPGRCDTSPSWDSGSYTLMEVVDWIPFENLEIYDANAWKGQTLPPSLYAWPAEQNAAVIETSWPELLEGEERSRLSARFTSWLGKDDEVMRLFGLAILYNLLTVKRDIWQIPGLGRLTAADLGSLCETLVDPERQPESLRQNRSDALLALRQAIVQRQTAEKNQKTVYLKRREKEVVIPLEKSTQAVDRDLGAYLRGLIELERNPGSELPA